MRKNQLCPLIGEIVLLTIWNYSNNFYV